jgi:hypothetical protein
MSLEQSVTYVFGLYLRAAEQLAAALEEHQDLRLTRLAGGKLERDVPARWRENE